MRRAAERDSRDKKPINKKKIIFFSIVLILVFGGFVYFINLPQYKVLDIEIKGQILGSEDELRSLIQSELSGSYFFVVPKTNIWFYPKGAIKNKLREYPQFESVDVSLDEERKYVVVSLEERRPKYVWCNDTDCYYMTESGFIFATAPAFEGTPYVVFTGLLLDDVIGKVFIDKKSFSEVNQFFSFLDSISIKEKKVDFISEDNLKIETSSGVSFYINLDRDIDKTIESLKTLLNSREFKAEVSDISNLEYLDVRFGNKAFWKTKTSGEVE